ncbi:MAG: hypothetical protein AAB037_00540, partial [Chloroflexota bacterium]
MTLDVQGLKRVLELEQQKGCEDKAVIGGLDRYLVHWARKAREGLNQPKLLSRFRELDFASVRYNLWEKEKRQRWLEDVFSFLAQVEAVQSHPRGDKASPPRPVSTSRRPRADLSLDSSLSQLPRVGTAMSAKFSRLGLKTIRDLLYF